MRLEDFPKALKNKKAYPPEVHKFLLALMEKFELCFPLEGKDGVYLVPGLLNANQPRELKKFMGGEARRIQFRSEDVRPPELLPRFIVRSHTLSERQPRWLRGVVLARGKARALVRGDHEGRVTDVLRWARKQRTACGSPNSSSPKCGCSMTNCRADLRGE